jgi:glutamate formiminotransferase/formiminotetrahydrofolate cyclodeaminase
MANKGNPASISDVGVGLLATRSAIEGAGMNVRINLAGIKDEEFTKRLETECKRISAESEAQFKWLLDIVESKLKQS